MVKNSAPELSAYDRDALQEIDDFKNPDPKRLSQLGNLLHKPLDEAGTVLFNTQVGEFVARGLGKAVEVLSDSATWTVREGAILERFHRADIGVENFDDIAKLELEAVDDVVGNLARKYRMAAMAEGMVVGAAGAVGMAVDIPLILGLSIRAAAEYATYYGFYPLTEGERSYVLDLVSTSSSPSQRARQDNLKALSHHSQGLAKGRWNETETLVTLQFIERTAEAFVARMAQGKFGQAVPLVGAFVGGGFNRWFVAQVVATAEAMYRERFLIRMFGDAVRVHVKDDKGSVGTAAPP